MAYNRTKTKSRLIVLTVAFILFILPLSSTDFRSNVAKAAGNEGKTYTLLEPLPCIPVIDEKTKREIVSCPEGAGAPMKEVDLGTFFTYAFNVLIALAAVAAVFMMVYGGFLYTSTSPMQKNMGKDKFFNAIYGLLMVLGAYLILRTVNPKLVEIPASIPPINVDKSKLQSPLDYFEKLSQEAEKHKVNTQQAIVERDAARAAANAAQGELDDINEKLNDIYDGNAGATPEQISQLTARRAQAIDDMNKNKSEAAVQTAVKIFEQDQTTITANADQNRISSWIRLSRPGWAASNGEETLNAISAATKDIYNRRNKQINELNSLSNSGTPSQIQRVNIAGDDAILRATQIYMEEYKDNAPTTYDGAMRGMKNIIAYKNSFELNDSVKNGQRNKSIVDFCRQQLLKLGMSEEKISKEYCF